MLNFHFEIYPGSIQWSRRTVVYWCIFAPTTYWYRLPPGCPFANPLIKLQSHTADRSNFTLRINKMSDIVLLLLNGGFYNHLIYWCLWWLRWIIEFIWICLSALFASRFRVLTSWELGRPGLIYFQWLSWCSELLRSLGYWGLLWGGKWPHFLPGKKSLPVLKHDSGYSFVSYIASIHYPKPCLLSQTSFWFLLLCKFHCATYLVAYIVYSNSVWCLRSWSNLPAPSYYLKHNIVVLSTKFQQTHPMLFTVQMILVLTLWIIWKLYFLIAITFPSTPSKPDKDVIMIFIKSVPFNSMPPFSILTTVLTFTSTLIYPIYAIWVITLSFFCLTCLFNIWSVAVI